MFLILLALLCAVAQSLTTVEKFALLKKALICEANAVENAVENWSRMSFHDLLLQTHPGIRGCLVNDDFMNHPNNVGLQEPTKKLMKIVMDTLGADSISFGDAIAFAGKVGYELRFPHMKISFSSGRKDCQIESLSLGNPPPSPSIKVMSDLKSTWDFLGLTAEEMAILIAGGHGLREARARASAMWGRFALIDSGWDYIVKTFSLNWSAIIVNEVLEFISGTDQSNEVLRTPSELLFYPSKVPEGNERDDSASGIEAIMRWFTTKDATVFDTAFAIIYGKMLAIGGDALTPLDEPLPDVSFTCPQTPNPPPPVTTTNDSGNESEGQSDKKPNVPSDAKSSKKVDQPDVKSEDQSDKKSGKKGKKSGKKGKEIKRKGAKKR